MGTFQYFMTLIGVISFIYLVSWRISDFKGQKWNRDLIKILQDWGGKPNREVLQGINDLFLDLFKVIYYSKEEEKPSNTINNLNSALWLFIILASVVSIWTIFGFTISTGTTQNQLEYVLKIVLFGAFFTSLAILIFITSFKEKWKMQSIRWYYYIIPPAIIALIMIFLFRYEAPDNLASIIDNYIASGCHGVITDKILVVNFIPLEKVTFSLGLLDIGIFFGIVAGLYAGFTTGRIVGAWVGVAVGLLSGFLAGGITNTILSGGIHTRPGTIIKIVGLTSLGLVTAGYIAVKTKESVDSLDEKHNRFFDAISKYFSINIVLTSLITITALYLFTSFFKPEAAVNFRSVILTGGWIYLILNIMADSFSIIETHKILEFAKRNPSILFFFHLLIIDFILSALIFLIIPFSSGMFTDALRAIIFQGSMPWMGILFWSTFSTSLIFYLFVISSCLIVMINPLRTFFLNNKRYSGGALTLICDVIGVNVFIVGTVCWLLKIYV